MRKTRGSSYSDQPRYFGPDQAETARQFASQASVAVGIAARLAAQSVLNGQLRASLVSQDLLVMLQDVPKRNGRLVVVLDNGSMHVSHVIKESLPQLKEEGIEFYYLPSYSPELNDIERVFGGIKSHDLPERSYATVPALMEAVDTAFTTAEARLVSRCQYTHLLSPAA